MTTELEQGFYDTFGIESKKLFSARQGINPDAVIYPEITAEKLLELICIKSKDGNGYRISANNYNDLRKDILKDLIKTYDIYFTTTWELERAEKLKQQIQQIFKDI